MEDRCICIDDLCEALPDHTFCEGYRYAYWAVYDGHAGSRAAEMSTEILHRLIVEDSSFTGNIPGAIQVGGKFAIFSPLAIPLTVLRVEGTYSHR